MKILVTGAYGTIGRAVTGKLIGVGHEVIGYDCVGSELQDGYTLIRGDVRDFAHLMEAAQSCDAGIHLAAVAGEAVLVSL